MADYQELPSVTEASFTSSSLSTETITAITTVLSGTGTVTIVTSIETTTIFTATETIVVTIDANFTGDLNQAAGDVDVIDGSSSDKGLDINFSAKEESAEQPENVTIGSDFDDKVVSNNNKQVVETGKGQDTITTGSEGDSVNAGEGNDSIATGAGDDSINAGTGNDSVDGGSGFDVVAVTSSFSQQTTSFNGSIFTSTDSSGNTVTIENTQVVTFGTNYQESIFILDNQGEARTASLFSALDRKMAPGGLKFFTKTAADSLTGLYDAAQSIVNSAEGQAKFASMSNSEFVQNMFKSYTNREGKEAGLKHFTDGLDSGVTDRAGIMVSFVETTEVTTITETYIHIVGVDGTIV